MSNPPPQALELPENKELKQRLTDTVAKVHGRGNGGSSNGGSAVGGLLTGLGSLIGIGSGKTNGTSGPAASSANGSSPAALLAECRRLAMQVVVPRQIRDQLEAAMRTAGKSGLGTRGH